MFTIPNARASSRAIKDARELLAAHLETLSQDEWNTVSLCEGWRVRDVVAHLIIEYHYSISHSWFDFLRAGLRTNIFLRDTAIRYGNHPTDRLLTEYNQLIKNDRSFKRVGPLNVLTDTLVHTQDILRSIGRNQPMDRSAVQLIFANWHPEAYNLGERLTGLAQRVHGLRFEASDINLIAGNGALVSGPATSLLMSVTGRKLWLDDLSGDGLPLLRERVK